MSSSNHSADVEKGQNYAHLTNDLIDSFAWNNITVTVKDRSTKQPIRILSGINGSVKAGEMLALMGPSGSGKTTLLNVLAHRRAVPNSTVQQELFINETPTEPASFRKLSCYVEQEDALVGSLTVRETLYFAAQLALPKSVSKAERKARIQGLLSAFGLQNQTETLIGTPIRKGVSGGQKRRVSVASQLITSPKILFLDEPTSGLDSAASFEVMNFVKDVVKKYKVLVIASIHQPSTTTFELFDKLMLLSQGKMAYNGPVTGVKDYFATLGHEMPLYTNPAEFIISLVNTDFSSSSHSTQTLTHIHNAWLQSPLASQPPRRTPIPQTLTYTHDTANPLLTPLTLIHRSFIKSYRDIVAYGIRIAMYLGLAIMMGTVWLRLAPTTTNMQNFTNAIFFGGAFMSFMAVAYIPAYLEDLTLFQKERSNGLYGATAFLCANFVIGVPYLFLIAVMFSAVSYWLGNFHPGPEAFWTWVLWLFLDLLAAEALVVVLASLVPVFVVALAVTAFANGLWMCVNGFMVQADSLNVFWRYVFHYVDYQAYVFRGMMVNEFKGRRYTCGEGCVVDGKEVLERYGFREGGLGKDVGIMLGIILGYRILGWVVLCVKRH